MEVYIDNRSEKIIDEEVTKKLEACIAQCILAEGFPDNCEISLSFVGDEEIQSLNKQYRNIDAPTDVLSFPLLDGEEDLTQEVIMLGDIIISIPRTQQQAIEYGHSFERELCYLTIHSMFHLFGYDHMEEEDKLVMRQKEKKVIRILNL